MIATRVSRATSLSFHLSSERIRGPRECRFALAGVEEGGSPSATERSRGLRSSDSMPEVWLAFLPLRHHAQNVLQQFGNAVAVLGGDGEQFLNRDCGIPRRRARACVSPLFTANSNGCGAQQQTARSMSGDANSVRHPPPGRSRRPLPAHPRLPEDFRRINCGSSGTMPPVSTTRNSCQSIPHRHRCDRG